jgi:hypothetical protein
MEIFDLVSLLISVVSFIVGLIVFIAILSIKNHIKRIYELSYFDFLEKNNLENCNFCKKFYSRELTKCPGCGSKMTKKSFLHSMLAKEIKYK